MSRWRTGRGGLGASLAGFARGPKRPILLLALVAWLTAESLGAAERIVLVAYTFAGREPVAGLRFSYQGIESQPTNRGGATELELPPGYATGRQIKIDLITTARTMGDSWFLINDLVNVPGAGESVALMLMRGTEMRQIGALVRDRTTVAKRRPGETSAEQLRRALAEVAASRGLTLEQLHEAIDSFARTPNTKDRGIALYLQGNNAEAEVILTQAAMRSEADLVDTLRYLGASQFAQAKYHEAASTIRKALLVRLDDADLLDLLGRALTRLDEWSAAEPPLRRALEIDETTFGAEHVKVARDLDDLAQLLEATNRMAEAEALMLRALAINEKRLGPEDPEVANDLTNLGLLYLYTVRIAKAEPLLRRALAINEKQLGTRDPETAASLNNLAMVLDNIGEYPEAEALYRRAIAIFEQNPGAVHPDTAIALNNLAELLSKIKRGAEAEPLIRRSLAIDEKVFGEQHAAVARDLVNLSEVLRSLNRIGEAEAPARRALAIAEKVYGPEYPDLASCMNNLGRTLQRLNRLDEAEPLMRRSLAILEKAYGTDNEGLAFGLVSLAELLQATNRAEEAEGLIRRALTIEADFARREGRPPSDLEVVRGACASLLRKMGKSQSEIDAIEGLTGQRK